MKLTNRLSVEQKNSIGTRIVETVDKRLEDILRRKPEPDMFYSRIAEVFDKRLNTQNNYLKLLSILPTDHPTFRTFLAKITNYSIKDHNGNNLLHVLLNRDMLHTIVQQGFYRLNLWESDNNMGVKPLDLLLTKLFKDNNKERDEVIVILRYLINNRILSDYMAKHVADSLLGFYQNTKDRRLLDLLVDLGKKYGKNTVNSVAKEIIKLDVVKNNYQEYLLWEHYTK
ncbi:MAG: hypothetical protein QXH89_02915 [Candidatus Anstonellales archaeon]